MRDLVLLTISFQRGFEYWIQISFAALTFQGLIAPLCDARCAALLVRPLTLHFIACVEEGVYFCLTSLERCTSKIRAHQRSFTVRRLNHPSSSLDMTDAESSYH